MAKKKIYISGPISEQIGTYRSKFAAAARRLDEAGFIPLSPAVLPLGMEDTDYMRISLAMLDSADEMVLLDGWESSEGARVEKAYAERVKKLVWPIEKFFISSYVPAKKSMPVEKKPMSRVERLFGTKEEWNGKGDSGTEFKEYKGFLLICCPECGEVSGFCSRKPIAKAYCQKCNAEIPLINMVSANVRCDKCGGNYYYKTNADTEKPLPFNCFGCKAPVDLQFDSKHKSFVTIRG